MKIAVAATAPFGADVLERLAARHDVAALLTRPDRPAGRGRKVAAPPAKLAAERLGIPVLQPERPTAELELPAETIVVVAYGLLIPDDLLERGMWLNVHPSLLPRWRGAAPVERALLAGDAETGVTIHETVKELDAGPIAAQRAFLVTPEDDAGTVYDRAAELAVELLDEVLPEPGVPAAGGRGDLRREDRARRPPARPLPSCREPEQDSRALAAHRGARRAARTAGHDLARAARGRGARAGGRAARGRQADGLRRLPARPALMEVAPARKAAYDVLRRVAEEGAYADRALRSASEGLDDRDRALARQLAFGSVQRLRTLDHAIETLGKRPVRKLDPPVLAALRLGAYQLGYLGGVPQYAAVNESVELVRRANLERAVPFTNAVLRRVSEGIALLLFELPEGPLKHSYPDWIWDVWRRDLGEEEALALMRAQNEPPPVVVRHVRGQSPDGAETDIPNAYAVDRVDEQALAEGRIWPQSRGSQLAGLVVGSREGERTLDLCAAPGGKATMLAGDVTAVEVNEARARELEENVARLGATNVRVVHADGLALPPELTGYDRALVDAPCSGLGVLAARPDLRWRSAPLPELQLDLLRAAAERTRAGGTIVYSVCTINADESEAVVDASGLTVDPIEEWPEFRHRSRPEFLQTLPHVHGTSGFFIARLRVPA